MSSRFSDPLDDLFSTNLAVRTDETVLVLTDIEPSFVRPVTGLAIDVAVAGLRRCLVRFCAFRQTGRHGIEPPVSAWRAAFGSSATAKLAEYGLLDELLAKRVSPAGLRTAAGLVRSHRRDVVDAALFMTTFSASHTRFRSLLTGPGGARVASMPGFTADMFGTAMAVSWRSMAERTRRVARRLGRAVAVAVRNPDGTDLEFSVRGRPGIADTGVLRAGEFGNLPAGEAYVAPIEGSARGTLSVRFGPAGRMAEPMRFTVRQGRAVRVAGGGRHGGVLVKLLRRHPECAVVAELGIGTNPRARKTGYILESEKAVGTVHVAFGDNASFGGCNRAPFHQDYLVLRPTVDLIFAGGGKERLLDRGRLDA